MTVEALKARFYPGAAKDGTTIFYRWMHECLRKNGVALNIGAGSTAADPLKSLRGKCSRVIGVDIDTAVLANQDLDTALLTDGVNLPIASNSIDLAWSDYVLEHVERPLALLKEVRRVLRSDGSYFFRTPNAFHYTTIGSRLSPYSLHLKAGPMLQGDSGNRRMFPVFYRCNSARRIRTLAKQSGFTRFDSRLIECEPSYLVFHPAAFLAGVAYERTVNRWPFLATFRANVFGRLQK